MTNSEILNQTENHFKLYLDSLDNYSDEVFESKKSDDIWSLAQLYDHVTKSALYFFIANTNRCLENRGGEFGGEKNKNGEGIFKYGGFPSMKFKMPEALNTQPIVGQSRAFYKNEISKILSAAAGLVPKLDKDAGEYKTMHPVLGMLNAKEWFHNLEMHTRHHLTQKYELEREFV